MFKRLIKVHGGGDGYLSWVRRWYQGWIKSGCQILLICH